MGNTLLTVSGLFFPHKRKDRLVGMWESRVLCEISKSLWEPFWGFHRDGISTAVFAGGVGGHRIPGVLRPGPVIDRRSWGVLCGRF